MTIVRKRFNRANVSHHIEQFDISTKLKLLDTKTEQRKPRKGCSNRDVNNTGPYGYGPFFVCSGNFFLPISVKIQFSNARVLNIHSASLIRPSTELLPALNLLNELIGFFDLLGFFRGGFDHRLR